MSPTAFWVDRGYDRDSASDGGSRYGAYVRERLGWFTDAGCWEWDDSAPRFAAVVWRIATGPVMVPGYVRMHPKTTCAESLVRNPFWMSITTRAGQCSLISYSQ